MVEPQPSTLTVRVRFSSLAPFLLPLFIYIVEINEVDILKQQLYMTLQDTEMCLFFLYLL